MSRPKTIRNGRKLNLYVPNTIKQRLFALASLRKKSVSAVVTELVEEVKEVAA